MERVSNIGKTLLLFGLFTIINNAITIIYKSSFDKIYFYVLPFVIVSLILLIFRKNQEKINAWLLYILGLIMCFIGERNSATGAAFIFFACYLDYGRNKTLVKILIMSACIALKSTIMEITASQTINFLALHYFILALGYQIFTKKKIVTIKEIEDQTEQIIDYMIEGFTIKEIAVKTFMTPAAVNKRINRLRDQEGCKTTYQLIGKLSINRHKYNNVDRFRVS